MLRGFGLLALVASAACELSPHGRCRLLPAQHVALAEGADFDGTALVTTAHGGLALYSDRSGLWARPLAEAGAPSARAERLGARCQGGIAAHSTGDAVVVACTRQVDQRGSVHALRLRVDAGGRVQRGAEITLAQVGPNSLGSSVSSLGAEVAIAFHDGGPDAHRIWLTRLPRALDVTAAPAPTLVSDARSVAQSPALYRFGEHLNIAFVTWDLEPLTQHATLHIRELGGSAHKALKLRHFDAAPRLSADGEGLLLSYRDRPSAHGRVEQFVAKLGPTLALRAPAVRIGRASGVWGPSLDHCGGRSFSAAPIEHGSELYVVFHALDGAFQALEPNHQCYATDRDLVGAQTACSGADVLALVAEQTDPSGPRAELFGMRFSCAP